MGIAIVIAIISSVLGLYASFYADVSSGAAIVLISTVLFILAWVIHAIKRRSTTLENDDDEVESLTRENSTDDIFQEGKSQFARLPFALTKLLEIERLSLLRP